MKMYRFNYFVISLFALCLGLVGCANMTTVANNVNEREANEIVVLLQSKGIDAHKMQAAATTTGAAQKETMWDIQVPAAQITDALAILNQAGLPRARGTKLLDLFGDKGLVPSDMQDRIRYQEGLSEQLAMTIQKMDGIIDANVQITFPSSEEEAERNPMTASVYVKHRGVLDNPNSLLITKIKRLISSAVPGLTIENVTVVADRALYADIAFPTGKGAEEEHYVVSIWGVSVAKESASLFRTIFYLFLLILFIAVAALGWMIWKCLPFLSLIHKKEGVKGFFSLKPFSLEEEKTHEESASPSFEEDEYDDEEPM